MMVASFWITIKIIKRTIISREPPVFQHSHCRNPHSSPIKSVDFPHPREEETEDKKVA